MFRSRSRCDALLAAMSILLALVSLTDARGADELSFDEFLAEVADETFDTEALEALLREAAAFRDNPVDVNSASLPVLLRVPHLDPTSAARIVAGRAEHGPAEALDALVARGALTETELERVRPYLMVAPHVATRAASTPNEQGLPTAPEQLPVSWELRTRAVTQERWETNWGEREVWNGAGTFVRLRVSYAERLSLSVVCERDVGEREFADHALGTLVWSGGVKSPDEGPVFTLGVGDLTGSWGQGLILKSGGFPSPGAYPRRRDILKPYDGAGESVSRRGAFVSASRGAVTVYGLLARTGLDAAFDGSGLATSIRTSGYHRTAGEREGASRLTESLSGVRVCVRAGAWQVSGSALRFGFEPGLAVGDPMRKRFAFSGDELMLGGVDACYDSDRVAAACEVASSFEGGAAAVWAVALRGERWRLKGGAGHLARDYWSPLGGGVPGFSGGSNGAAGWLRTEYRSGSNWSVWATTRTAGRPWRSYHSELPDASTSLALGGELKTKRGWRLAAESGASSRVSSIGNPAATVDTIVRRDRVSLSAGRSTPVSVAFRRSASLKDGVEQGAVTAMSLRMDGGMGDAGDYVVGVTAVSSQGAPPTLVHYEPRLPGEFGLRSLNATGTRWYARVRAALPAGLGLSVRIGGGPERGMTEFGVGLDARG